MISDSTNHFVSKILLSVVMVWTWGKSCLACHVRLLNTSVFSFRSGASAQPSQAWGGAAGPPARAGPWAAAPLARPKGRVWLRIVEPWWPVMVYRSRRLACVRLAWRREKQLSAEVQYIIPTNHACRIVTRVCASLYCSFTAFSPTGHTAHKPLRRYAIGRELDPVVVYITIYLLSHLLRFLSHFTLYQCHLFSLTSIFVIIYIC